MSKLHQKICIKIASNKEDISNNLAERDNSKEEGREPEGVISDIVSNEISFQKESLLLVLLLLMLLLLIMILIMPNYPSDARIRLEIYMAFEMNIIK